MCIIIGDLHQFIRHCLIPLNPCNVILRVSELTSLFGREAAAPYAQAATWAHDAGLGVNAGHDLNLNNLRDFAEAVPHLDEVSIGHALISDALYLGLSNTVAQYRACLHPVK